MSEYGKRIRRVTEDRKETLGYIEDTLRDLGAKIAELPEEERPADTESIISEYHDLNNRINQAGSAIERMLNIDARQNEIKQSMKNLRSEREDLGRGLSGVYEQIGAVAFRLFRESPLLDAAHSAAFEELARHQDEIRSIENKLNQIDWGEEQKRKAGILRRVRAGSKDAYLRSRRNAHENRLPRLLQTAGEQLAQGAFIENVDDDELNKVAEPLLTVKRRWNEIDTQLEDLSRESGQLVEEFNQISNGKGLNRARSEKETDIQRAREELNDVLLTLGLRAEEQELQQFSALLTQLEKQRREVAQQDTLLARLNAGLQAEKVTQDIESCVKQQEKVNRDIEELRERETRLKEEKQTLDAQLQQLEHERGDPAELLNT